MTMKQSSNDSLSGAFKRLSERTPAQVREQADAVRKSIRETSGELVRRLIEEQPRINRDATEAARRRKTATG